MSDNKLYAVGWLCAMIMVCSLIFGVTYYNVTQEKLLKDKQIEFAKAGLHQKIEITGKVIWVKGQ